MHPCDLPGVLPAVPVLSPGLRQFSSLLLPFSGQHTGRASLALLLFQQDTWLHQGVLM